MPDIYRAAASVLVLRPSSSEGYQMLLLHKPRKKDSWQLPQGGVEQGETVPVAALRELQEEAGIIGCRLLGESERVYAYDFPPSFRRFRPDNVKGQRIRYVFAEAPKDATVTVDGKEVDAFLWVDLSQVPLHIHRKEYAELVVSLYEEAMNILRQSMKS